MQDIISSFTCLKTAVAEAVYGFRWSDAIFYAAYETVESLMGVRRSFEREVCSC